MCFSYLFLYHVCAQNECAGFHNYTITTIAYYNYTELKNQLKIANYETVGKKISCPLDGKCLTKCVVYNATVTETTSNNQETYIGLTENEFKTRLNLHKSSFKLEHKRTSTTLSEHVCKLKKTKTSTST